MTSFTRELWASIDELYDAVLAHPFITGLADGSLPPAAFQAYVVQDAHYLRQYARALALTSAKGRTEDEIAAFAAHAAGAIAVERGLHASFFADFGLSDEAVAATPMAPTNLAYTSFLVATTATGSFGECLGAVLPCYWIYWEVGKELVRRGSANPLYQRWVDTYAGDEFARLVEEVLAITDSVGQEIGPTERARAGEHFRTTSRYEWMFWDMGWRQEAWPI